VYASRWERLALIAGIVFALLLLAGLILLDLDDVGGDASRGDVVSTYSDGATEWKKEVGATLVGFAIFFLLLFLGRLRTSVRSAEGEPGTFSSAGFAGGVVFAALLGASAALDTAVVSTVGFFENYQVDADTPLVLVSLSNWTRGFATVGGGVLVGATSVVALKTLLFPRWLAIGGLAVAVIAFFGETTAAFGFPILLILLWVLATSVLLVRRDRAAAPAR
jgi:hypothetical protein